MGKCPASTGAELLASAWAVLRSVLSGSANHALMEKMLSPSGIIYPEKQGFFFRERLVRLL